MSYQIPRMNLTDTAQPQTVPKRLLLQLAHSSCYSTPNSESTSLDSIPPEIQSNILNLQHGGRLYGNQTIQGESSPSLSLSPSKLTNHTNTTTTTHSNVSVGAISGGNSITGSSSANLGPTTPHLPPHLDKFYIFPPEKIPEHQYQIQQFTHLARNPELLLSVIPHFNEFTNSKWRNVLQEKLQNKSHLANFEITEEYIENNPKYTFVAQIQMKWQGNMVVGIGLSKGKKKESTQFASFCLLLHLTVEFLFELCKKYDINPQRLAQPPVLQQQQQQQPMLAVGGDVGGSRDGQGRKNDGGNFTQIEVKNEVFNGDLIKSEIDYNDNNQYCSNYDYQHDGNYMGSNYEQENYQIMAPSLQENGPKHNLSEKKAQKKQPSLEASAQTVLDSIELPLIGTIDPNELQQSILSYILMGPLFHLQQKQLATFTFIAEFQLNALTFLTRFHAAMILMSELCNTGDTILAQYPLAPHMSDVVRILQLKVVFIPFKNPFFLDKNGINLAVEEINAKKRLDESNNNNCQYLYDCPTINPITAHIGHIPQDSYANSHQHSLDVFATLPHSPHPAYPYRIYHTDDTIRMYKNSGNIEQCGLDPIQIGKLGTVNGGQQNSQTYRHNDLNGPNFSTIKTENFQNSSNQPIELVVPNFDHINYSPTIYLDYFETLLTIFRPKCVVLNSTFLDSATQLGLITKIIQFNTTQLQQHQHQHQHQLSPNSQQTPTPSPSTTHSPALPYSTHSTHSTHSKQPLHTKLVVDTTNHAVFSQYDGYLPFSSSTTEHPLISYLRYIRTIYPFHYRNPSLVQREFNNANSGGIGTTSSQEGRFYHDDSNLDDIPSLEPLNDTNYGAAMDTTDDRIGHIQHGDIINRGNFNNVNDHFFDRNHQSYTPESSPELMICCYGSTSLGLGSNDMGYIYTYPKIIDQILQNVSNPYSIPPSPFSAHLLKELMMYLRIPSSSLRNHTTHHAGQNPIPQQPQQQPQQQPSSKSTVKSSLSPVITPHSTNNLQHDAGVSRNRMGSDATSRSSDQNSHHISNNPSLNRETDLNLATQSNYIQSGLRDDMGEDSTIGISFGGLLQHVSSVGDVLVGGSHCDGVDNPNNEESQNVGNYSGVNQAKEMMKLLRNVLFRSTKTLHQQLRLRKAQEALHPTTLPTTPSMSANQDGDGDGDDGDDGDDDRNNNRNTLTIQQSPLSIFQSNYGLPSTEFRFAHYFDNIHVDTPQLSEVYPLSTFSTNWHSTRHFYDLWVTPQHECHELFSLQSSMGLLQSSLKKFIQNEFFGDNFFSQRGDDDHEDSNGQNVLNNQSVVVSGGGGDDGDDDDDDDDDYHGNGKVNKRNDVAMTTNTHVFSDDNSPTMHSHSNNDKEMAKKFNSAVNKWVYNNFLRDFDFNLYGATSVDENDLNSTNQIIDYHNPLSIFLLSTLDCQIDELLANHTQSSFHFIQIHQLESIHFELQNLVKKYQKHPTHQTPPTFFPPPKFSFTSPSHPIYNSPHHNSKSGPCLLCLPLRINLLGLHPSSKEHVYESFSRVQKSVISRIESRYLASKQDSAHNMVVNQPMGSFSRPAQGGVDKKMSTMQLYANVQQFLFQPRRIQQAPAVNIGPISQMTSIYSVGMYGVNDKQEEQYGNRQIGSVGPNQVHNFQNVQPSQPNQQSNVQSVQNVQNFPPNVDSVAHDQNEMSKNSKTFQETFGLTGQNKMAQNNQQSNNAMPRSTHQSNTAPVSSRINIHNKSHGGSTIGVGPNPKHKPYSTDHRSLHTQNATTKSTQSHVRPNINPQNLPHPTPPNPINQPSFHHMALPPPSNHPHALSMKAQQQQQHQQQQHPLQPQMPQQSQPQHYFDPLQYPTAQPHSQLPPHQTQQQQVPKPSPFSSYYPAQPSTVQAGGSQNWQLPPQQHQQHQQQYPASSGSNYDLFGTQSMPATTIPMSQNYPNYDQSAVGGYGNQISQHTQHTQQHSANYSDYSPSPFQFSVYSHPPHSNQIPYSGSMPPQQQQQPPPPPPPPPPPFAHPTSRQIFPQHGMGNLNGQNGNNQGEYRY